MTGVVRLGTALGRRSALLLAVAGTVSLTQLHPRPRLFVVGDSWAAGLHADPRHALGQVAAADLGWSVGVDAASGTGYLNPAGGRGTYAARLARTRTGGTAQVVVLQGGSNDDREDLGALPGAVSDTVRTARVRFPGARIVMLGPGPDPAPVTALQRRVDDVLERSAAGEQVAYISMLRQDWVPAADPAAVIDPTTNHPTVGGQRALGLRLGGSLRRMFPDLRA